ncbi:exocyst complex component EXO70B1-like [Abrus precatorius]|uniref:Exocyst subunit Exo70 family protein n=1 Tax=Abrus precatorius TaxID=3816 RepID=A0A8B8JQ53_ABRPR|nr:exocyst complex component EXO70B1-like [Abrus precatorius]
MSPILVQILRWFMQSKLWRFLGFASALVGLLSYALSSSFTHLFGNWNSFKIFLYTVFSFIICVMVLFAKIWQHCSSMRLKAHSIFLVLTITSIYSFFVDKVVTGKPDAYSLISCVAFAIMSLSLSRQTQCGFEADLLYFFLGCLTVQLMKIKLQLVVVGVGFSYAVIILRYYLHATQVNEYRALEDQRHVVIQVDSQQLSNTNRATIREHFITCMEKLQENNLNVTNLLLKQVKNKCEVFVTDHNFFIDALPAETINNLHEAAKLMASVGFEKECFDVYSCWRRKWLEECVINKFLGLQKMGFHDYMIGRWNKASKVALRIVFPSERRLCDCVFSGFSSVDVDLCFLEVCGGATVKLLNFADAFVSRSPEAWRLFKIIDMFKTLRDLIPEFRSLFPKSLVNEAITVKNRLGEACRDIFMEFETLIFQVPSAELDASDDGGVHPMTSSVINNLLPAYWSQQILDKILQEYPKVNDGAGAFSFSVLMNRIMKQLERKLESKSKIYKDPALCYFFIMNNLRCVQWQLETLADDDWFRKSTEQNFELYQRSSWNKVLDLLKLDCNELMAPIVEAESMQDKLNLFNKYFEEICSVQSTWHAFDKQLREQIIISLENIFLPAYGNFIGRFHEVLGMHADEYIDYGVSDIQDRLNNLFDGSKLINQCS